MEWQNTKILLWRVTESPDELLEWHIQNGFFWDEKELQSRSHPLRKVHYLLANWWLHRQLSETTIYLKYLPNGCPQIEGANDYYTSISHSGPFLAITLKKGNPIGIDIEWMKRKRPFAQLASYFMNEQEYHHFKNNPNSFFFFWCSKESVYKIFAQFDSDISFKKEISVNLIENTAFYKRRKQRLYLHPFQWKDEIFGVIATPETLKSTNHFE